MPTVLCVTDGKQGSFSDGDEDVCGSAEIKVALDYLEWTMFSSTGKVFFFLFFFFFLYM